jgi:hypothetical protein
MFALGREFRVTRRGSRRIGGRAAIAASDHAKFAPSARPGVARLGVDLAPAFECTPEGELVGVLEVTPDR